MIKKMNFRISAATWTAKFFLSTFLIFYLVQKTNAHDIKELFFGANNKYFFIIFFLVLSQVILAVIRWKSLLAFIANKNIFFFSLLKNYLSSLFIGNFLPGALGFDFFRYLFIKKQGVPFDKNLSILIIDRFFMLCSCLLISYLYFCVYLFRNNFSHFIYFVLFGASCFFSFFFIKSFFFLLPSKISSFLKKFSFIRSNFRNFLSLKFLGKYSVNILFSVILNALIVHLIFMSLRVFVPLIDCLFLGASILIVNSLPISFSGWGAREFYLIKILPLYQISFNVALTFSFLYGISLFIISIPGVLLLISSIIGKKTTFPI